MRKIKFANEYKRDVRRISGGQMSATALDALLFPILQSLASDAPLPKRNNDHELKGNWKNYRECHIKPDLLLIYAKPNDETLWLARLGSHSELKLA